MMRINKKLISVVLCLALLFQAASPAMAAMLPAVASGTVVHSNAKAKIDASNVKDGYIMAAYTAKTQKRVKVRVTGPDKSVYTYDLNNTGKYEVFPLSAGEGKYKIGVYENYAEMLKEYRRKIHNAGQEKVIAEIQRQLDEQINNK